MKKATRIILLFVVAVCLLAAFAGCDQEPAVQSGSLQVNTIKIMPYAYLNEEFDLRDVLLMEEGVEYSATACYVDISTLTEYPLEVNDLCFTPEAVAETVVVLSANRGKETAAKVIYIPTTIRAEPIDDLYKSSGPLGGSDPGISKSVNINPLYLQGDTSTTSLHIEFNSTDPHPYGNQFMNFSAPAVQEYFTDKTWENAIVTFWVYNPMEKPIEFQFRLTDGEIGTNLDWQTVDGPHKQFALPGQWTQLFFSLRKLGTTHRLTSGTYSEDYLSLKFRYEDYNTKEAYSFDFYMDNIDVVDASMYPEVDTKFVLSNEKIEQGWENMKFDGGWHGAYTEYDYEQLMGEGSTCSLKATFPGEKGKTNSFICLSPEAQFDENPDMTGGKFHGYFKFENMDAKVMFDIVNTKWETSNKIEMPLRAVGDGWYYGEIDLEDVEVGSGRNDEIIRIRLHFSGITDSSVVYVDTLKYDYKYVEKVLESVAADWINLATDRGDYYWNVESKYVTNYLKGSNTVRSLMVKAPANAAGKFTFNTGAAASAGEISVEPDMRFGTLGAWFYFGKQLPNAGMRVTSHDWKGSVELPFVFTKNAGDGWYYGELHGSDIKFTEGSNASKIIRFTLTVPKGYTTYVDNLHWFGGVENDLVAAEIDPSVLFDGGDFLAGTDSLSYDVHHWENVPNDDGKPDTVSGLTCGVDTTNVYGPYSVRSWYFKAAAENATSHAIAQLKFAKGYDMTGKLLAFDIRIDSDSKIQQQLSFRLHTAGWSDMNHVNPAIKLNADETWKTVVIDFTDLFLEGADITNFGMISMYFDFKANSGKDRAIYIDNVRLMKPEEVPADAVMDDEIPEDPDPSDSYDGGDLFAIAQPASGDNRGIFDGSGNYSYDFESTKLYDGNEVGKYSVKSVKVTSTNPNECYPTALIDLGRSVNMNGRVLAMDVFFENTKGNIAVYTLHNSGWSGLNTTENAANYVQSVPADGWTTVYFNIQEKLAEGKDLSDVKFVKLQYFFDACAEGEERSVYIDNVRLVDPSEIPPVDDTSIDWTNMSQDKGPFYHNMVTNEFSGLYIKGEFSTKSLHVVAPADTDGKVTFNTSNAQDKGEIEKLPNMNAGTLGAWFYFGEQAPAASLRIGEAGWDNSRLVPFVFGEGEDGWYYGTVDCSTAVFPKTFYPGLTIRATIFIPAGYDVCIDSMTFEPADIADPGELAEDPDDILGPVKALEYNVDHWTATTGLIVKPDTEHVYTANTASIRSMSFRATAEASMDRATAQFTLPEKLDMTGYNLAFDVLYVAETKAQQKIQIRLHSGGDMTGDESVKVNPGEWKTVVVNFDDVLLTGKDYTGLSHISFYLDFKSNTGVERAVYIDNVRFTTDAETEDDEPLPLDPSELYDGGDLLANATVEWNPSLWDGDPASYDANCTELYTENEVGKYSVKSWKFYTSQDNWSEGVQLKLGSTFDLTGKNIEFDVKFINATQTIGIELFNNWTALQPDNTPIATFTGDGSDGWQTAKIGAEVLAPALEGKAHNEISLIRFKFNFTSETSGEHAVIIDNVRFTESNYYENVSDLLGAADVDVEAWNDGLTLLRDHENTFGKQSKTSWMFAAAAEKSAAVDACFKLYENTDMTGKYLVFDAKTTAAQKLTVTLLDENQVALTDAVCLNASSENWQQVLANVDAYVLEGQSLSAVRYVAFSFDYASNTGAERCMYIDNLRLVDVETVENDWIHMEQIVDEGFKTADLAWNGAFVKAENSVASLQVTAPADAAGIFTLDIENGYEKLLKHRGDFGAWFYFGDQAPDASVSATESGGNVCAEALAFTFGEGDNGWYYGNVDLSKILYAESVNRAYITKLTISIPQGYVVYVDGINYADIQETADMDLINLPHSAGELTSDVVFGDESAQSLLVDASSKAANLDFTMSEAMDISASTMEVWFYFGDAAPSGIRYAAFAGSSNTGYINITFADEDVNGWYKGTVSASNVPANKQAILSNVNKIRFSIPKGTLVYMDCLSFVEATE